MKDLRRNYLKGNLLENDLPDEPFHLFENWFDDAQKSEVLEPNAMVLSTINENKVDSRTVLLKGLRFQQFVFYTNYESNKATQLVKNSACSLLFLWLPLERQVIVRGHATKVSEKESEDYFSSRPRKSQIGAWVSKQSKPIENRDELENIKEEFTCKFEGELIMKPENWGGFEVTPYEVEFWHGREDRLHDRILYKKQGDAWEIIRLQP